MATNWPLLGHSTRIVLLDLDGPLRETHGLSHSPTLRPSLDVYYFNCVTRLLDDTCLPCLPGLMLLLIKKSNTESGIPVSDYRATGSPTAAHQGLVVMNGSAIHQHFHVHNLTRSLPPVAGQQRICIRSICCGDPTNTTSGFPAIFSTCKPRAEQHLSERTVFSDVHFDIKDLEDWPSKQSRTS